MTQVLFKSGAFVFIILLGFFLKSAGVFGKEDYQVLSRVVLNISLPAAIITSFSGLKLSMALMLLPLLGLVINFLQIFGGWLLAKKKPPLERILYMFNSSGYNIGAFAIPFVQSYFGPGAVAGMCLFDVGNGLMCTGANYGVVRSMVPADGERLTPAVILKRMFGTLTFPTYLVMVALSLLNITLPAQVIDFISPIARANPFVAMLMVGTMFEFHPRKEYLEPIVKVIGWRLVLGAGLAALSYFMLPLPLEIRQALVVVSFAPASVVSPAFTARCGGNAQLAGCLNSCSILVGIPMMLLMLCCMGLA